jgi:hypothetical protein
MTFRNLCAVLAFALPAVPALAQTAEDFPAESLFLLDKNTDGTISAEEIDAFAVTILPVMDTNEDGTVTKEEVLVVLTEEQFTAADTNADGVLSLEELTAVVRADFAAADMDGSGHLN